MRYTARQTTTNVASGTRTPAAVRRAERAASETGPYEPVLRVETRREGGAVSVAVSDNGPGLAAPLRQRVFEPFYTTRPPGSGHPGLGLSLAHETVVGGYGGQIEVESEEGVGSTFTARLPAG